MREIKHLQASQSDHSLPVEPFRSAHLNDYGKAPIQRQQTALIHANGASYAYPLAPKGISSLFPFLLGYLSIGSSRSSPTETERHSGGCISPGSCSLTPPIGRQVVAIRRGSSAALSQSLAVCSSCRLSFTQRHYQELLSLSLLVNLFGATFSAPPFRLSVEILSLFKIQVSLQLRERRQIPRRTPGLITSPDNFT